MYPLLQFPVFDTYSEGQKIFLETWFNLTYQGAPDSYRVRCHNALTILEELDRELRLNLVNTEEVGTIAAEAMELCEKDTVFQNEMGRVWPIAKALLVSLTKGEKSEASAREHIQQLLNDTLPILPKPYLAELFKNLSDAIGANDRDKIIHSTGSIVTQLVSRGWSVESLHAAVTTAFLKIVLPSRPFADQFAILRSRLSGQKQEYEVVVSVSGAEVDQLGEFCGFKFSATPPEINDHDPGQIKFAKENQHRAFATTRVMAVDQFSATHAAIHKFEKCQDRLRYHAAPIMVQPSSRLLVTRSWDKKRRMVPLLYGITSPGRKDMAGFIAAHEALDKRFASGEIEESSVRRIDAAIRHYRLGWEKKEYRDMLLNWWMGLETLTGSGEGKGIGARVSTNSLPLLTYRYLQYQFTYLTHAVSAACKTLPAEVAGLLAIDPADTLEARQTIKIMADPVASASIEAKLVTIPSLLRRWNFLKGLSTSAGALREYISSHETRVRWHLHRLYRVRCCLVHGTPVEVPLQLFSANMEYYLRESLQVVIDAIGKYPNITSLENLYNRGRYLSVRRRNILTDGKGTALADYLDAGFLVTK